MLGNVDIWEEQQLRRTYAQLRAGFILWMLCNVNRIQDTDMRSKKTCLWCVNGIRCMDARNIIGSDLIKAYCVFINSIKLDF